MNRLPRRDAVRERRSRKVERSAREQYLEAWTGGVRFRATLPAGAGARIRQPVRERLR